VTVPARQIGLILVSLLASMLAFSVAARGELAAVDHSQAGRTSRPASRKPPLTWGQVGRTPTTAPDE
jgi:hypothetical protein